MSKPTQKQLTTVGMSVLSGSATQQRLSYSVTDRGSREREGRLMRSVVFVCPSVRLFIPYLSNRPTFDREQLFLAIRMPSLEVAPTTLAIFSPTKVMVQPEIFGCLTVYYLVSGLCLLFSRDRPFAAVADLLVSPCDLDLMVLTFKLDLDGV